MDAINLPGFYIISTEEAEHDFRINVACDGTPKRCERCSSRTADLKRYDARDHWFFDFPIRGKRVKLCVKHRRFKCPECSAVFFEPLPGMDVQRDMTERLVTWIAQESMGTPFNRVAHQIGCTDTTVRNIFHQYLEQQSKSLKFVTPRILGIDEICLGKRKGDKYRCVITDIEQKTLVEFLRDRNKQTVIKFLSSLDREAVDVICMDMWVPYRDAARVVFPKAPVVIDRFHIARMVQNSMEAFRKALRKDTTGKERAMLKSDRFVLLSRNIDLDVFQQATLGSWIKKWPHIKDVYDAKERFLDIWLADTRSEAIFLYNEWEASIPEHVKSYFTDIFTAFENWSVEIFNYWDFKFTNAFTEALNNGIRAVYDSGNGYSFEVLRAKLLYTKGTHKIFKLKPKYDKKAFEGVGFIYRYTPGMHEPEESKTLNYGVDISTLLEFIKEGKI